MAARKGQDTRPALPIILYAPLGELKVYEVSEAELEKLEAGPPGLIHLNFALAMIPTAITILITLQTATITSPRVFTAYLVAFWALSVQGAISLVRWQTSNRTFRKLTREIRARMPARPILAEQLPPQPTPVDAE